MGCPLDNVKNGREGDATILNKVDGKGAQLAGPSISLVERYDVG